MLMLTKNLTGPALRWAVALCEQPTLIEELKSRGVSAWAYIENFHPDTDWSRSGPIIDQNKIDLYQSTGRNAAAMWENLPGGGRLIAESKDTPTILIAAMRCYVASKLGDEVDIPEELLS